MIEFIQGQLRTKSPQLVIIDVGGISLGVHIPISVFERLPKSGEEVGLWTYLNVTEHEIALYGFLQEEEKELFKLFLSVSGIGPRMGLAVLSALGVEEFAQAILDENLTLLTQVPGIGKKTADRLVIEMRDKVKQFAMVKVSGGKRPSREETSKIEDATAALIALGCKPPVASRAVRKALETLGNAAPLEELIRESLRHRGS